MHTNGGFRNRNIRRKQGSPNVGRNPEAVRLHVNVRSWPVWLAWVGLNVCERSCCCSSGVNVHVREREREVLKIEVGVVDKHSRN